jgi:hypothetical protein
LWHRSLTVNNFRRIREDRDSHCNSISPTEWDAFYVQQQHQKHDDQPSSHIEWHDSISLYDIAAAVPPNCRCLMVGCGTSRLPQVVLQQQDPPKSLVLLDSSSTCLDQLKGIYGMEYGGLTTLEYVCGDATRLTNYFDVANAGQALQAPADAAKSPRFDLILDKGLTDAILCSEGWDGPLERMFHEASQIMTPQTGQYLLISYALPRTTRDFLLEVGRDAGLEWHFDVDLSSIAPRKLSEDPTGSVVARTNNQKSRVSIALATKKADA